MTPEPHLCVALTFTAAALGAARNSHPRIELLVTRLPPLLGALLLYGIDSVEQAVDVSMVSPDLSQGWAYVVLPTMAGATMERLCQRFDVALGAAALQFPRRPPAVSRVLAGSRRWRKSRFTLDRHHRAPRG